MQSEKTKINPFVQKEYFLTCMQYVTSEILGLAAVAVSAMSGQPRGWSRGWMFRQSFPLEDVSEVKPQLIWGMLVHVEEGLMELQRRNDRIQI